MRLRIATFNLESLDETRSGGAPLEARLPILRPQLLRLDADVLCLQEVNAQRVAGAKARRLVALDRLLEATPYTAFYRAVSLGLAGRAPADRHNLAILSRWPIAAWRSLRHALVPPPEVRLATAEPLLREPQRLEWDRPLLQARITLPGGRHLEIVNLHLRAPLPVPVPGQKAAESGWRSLAGWAEGYYLATVKRAGQALEARLLVEELLQQDPAALVALCGDLNADEPESPLRILLGETESGEGRLAALELIALARGLPHSRRYSVLHGGTRALYDHILVSRALSGYFRNLELHNEALSEEGLAGPASPESFHAPLVADFALPQAS